MQMHQSATRATRAEAYALIVDLKIKRRELDPEDLDSLLLYFAPPLPKKARTVEQWVAKAVASGKEARAYLRYLFVKDGIIMASDGHRAHRGKTSLADGFYCPKTFAPVDFDGVFPDLDRVYPIRSKLGVFEVNTLVKGAVLKEKTGKTLAYRQISNGAAVDEAYLADALNGREDGVIRCDDEGRCMVGDSEFGEWVVMGMRV